jgi:hypothetical protein
MQKHKRVLSGHSTRSRISKITHSISPIRRITGRINLNNFQLPKFVRVDQDKIEQMMKEAKYMVNVQINKKKIPRHSRYQSLFS